MTSPTPFKAIAALSLNRVIGKDGSLPWHIPEDLTWMRQRTRQALCIMGRKTFESLPPGALPGREKVVLTRQSNYGAKKATVVHTLEDAMRLGRGRERFIFGGEEIYRMAMPLTGELYLTWVKREVEGDTFFPPFEDQFQLAVTLRETPEFSIQHYLRIPTTS
jgi:dihydrofolate reductase